MAETTSRSALGARVVVGMDFGTTFSGFAVALVGDPAQQIHTFYEWPLQERGGGKPYCKTQTSLLYTTTTAAAATPGAAQGPAAEYELQHWGWPAQVAYLDNLQARRRGGSRARAPGDDHEQQAEEVQSESEIGFFVPGRTKLLLAGPELQTDTPDLDPTRIWKAQSSKPPKPPPATVQTFQSESSNKGLLKRITPDWLLTRSVSRMKLSSTKEEEVLSGSIAPALLPPGMAVERAISDFLAKLAQLAVSHVQSKYGAHMAMSDVQWCLTVPAIWDDSAKQQMIRCAQMAGMVTGAHCPADMVNSASPHPLRIVLESEAAALFCYKKAAEALGLRKGHQFVVADVGGGTVDIVVHSLADDEGRNLREVAMSSGGLCGGTYVDSNFLAYLTHRIPCFRQYVEQNPSGIRVIMRRWEEIKCSFDGSPGWGSQMFEIPTRLAAAWRSFDQQLQYCDTTTTIGKLSKVEYDEIEMTSRDMEAIFDPVVNKVVESIRAQLQPEVRALMVVGGFSASAYLMKRIHEKLGKQVPNIINPPNPGSAICQGAVIFGLQPDILLCRVSRRTYGIKVVRPFRLASDPIKTLVMYDGRAYRSHIFCVYVRRGDVVGVDDVVANEHTPTTKSQESLSIPIYSSDSRDPRFTDEPGVRREGKFVLDISDDPHNLGLERRVLVSMHFGRTSIQVHAQRVNFGDTSEVVKLEHTVPFRQSVPGEGRT